MQCVEFHTGRANNHKALALCVGHHHPLHIATLASFTHFHVGNKEIVYVSLVNACIATFTTTHIVFAGAAAIPLDLFKAARNSEEGTHIGNCRLCCIRGKGVIHQDIARTVNGVAKFHGRVASRNTQIEVKTSFVVRNLGDLGAVHLASATGLAPDTAFLFHVVALIVVGRSTPEVRNAASGNQLHISQLVIFDGCICSIDCNGEIIAFNNSLAIAFGNLVLGQAGEIQLRNFILTQLHHELFVGNAKANVGPILLVLQLEINIQVVFGASLECGLLEIDGNFLFRQRSNIKLSARKSALGHFLAIFLQGPNCSCIILQVHKVKTVLDFHSALCGTLVANNYVTVLVLDFPHFGLQGTIRKNQAVGAEVIVVGLIAPEAAEIKVLGTVAAQALVNKVPNEATENTGVAVERVYIFLKFTHGVTHGVFVFAKHPGLVIVVVGGGSPVATIHAALNVGIVVVAFVMHRARRVCLMGIFAHGGKNITVAGFVTQGPNDNGSMVLVTLNHGTDTFQGSRAPIVIALGNLIVCTVGFQVRFIKNINTVLIAKIVHVRIIRIMGSTQSVNVKLLHEEHIAFHHFAANRMTIIRIDFMTVHTAQNHRLAVHQELGNALGVFLQFHLLKANAVTFNLYSLTRSILQSKHEGIEVRSFGSPQLNARNRLVKGNLSFCACSNRGNGSLVCNNSSTRGIVYAHFKSVGTGGRAIGVLHPDARIQGTVGVVACQGGIHLEVLNVCLGSGVDVHITLDTGKADKVLVFHPGAITPAEHLHGDVVFATAKLVGNIEFVVGKGVFTIANELAVHPNIVSGFHTFKVQANALAIPILGHGKVTAVMAHRVKLCGRCRRVNPVVLVPRINHVTVNGMVVAINLPVARNRNIVPLGNVVIVGKEVVVTLSRSIHMEELPGARQTLVPFRTAAIHLQCFFKRIVRHAGHVRRKHVNAKSLRISVPLVKILSQGSSGKRKRHSGCKCQFIRFHKTILPYYLITHPKLMFLKGKFTWFQNNFY